MARIIVSAGHTTNDPGSVSGGLREVDFTRAIARKIIPHLRASGVITLSVPPDLDLAKRIDWINGTGYSSKFNDIAIEIHINDGGKSGFEFWYGGSDEKKSSELAHSVMSTVTSHTGLPNQGVHPHTEHEFGSLAFIDQTNTVSVILECLYIDNPEDISRLKNESEVDKIAKQIAHGVLKYLKVEFKEAPTQKPVYQEQSNQPSYQNSPQMNFPSEFGNQRRPEMTKAQREQMIISTYQRILGRNPNQNDMNYFLNIGIDEDGLVRRMMNSQEHLEILQAAQQYFISRQKFEYQNVELTRLQVESRDKDIMLHNYKQLLQQKNQHITSLNAQLRSYSGKSSGSKKSEPKKKQYKGTFLDRVFHFFSGILG